MKYLVLLGDGMADYPLPGLGGKTPLEVAYTPHMDWIAGKGTIGLVDTIPQGFTPGSDVAIMSILGYDPLKYYTGRGPLEAASMGVKLGEMDIAYRCNLVTLSNDGDPVMLDFTAGHISTSEAREIVKYLQEKLSGDECDFFPGISYRHIFVWHNGSDRIQTTPPHDIVGKRTGEYLPQGDRSDFLLRVMDEAKILLRNHPANARRIAEGKRPANAIWLWGQGRAPQLSKIAEKYGLKGGMISAVDLLKGLGIYAGLTPIEVEGATGYIDTNYRGKAEKALEALRVMDFVFVHVEAPDEMGHEGNVEGKIKAIEDFDEKVVGTVLEALPKLGPARLMVLSDHPTPITLRTHASSPSPFAVFSTELQENMGKGLSFSEKSAEESGLLISPGTKLLNLFIQNWSSFISKQDLGVQ
ncbi:MAG: cofactor-independent phosphoglycerate mutase [Syntrophales bacterium]|nr:cofactor-independent phosphoglycerate mutase [Syntrophales bacterium]